MFRTKSIGDNVAKYWSDHNVTLHRRFESAEESLNYFWWRNDQYPGFIELLPVGGYDGKRILDFGCGPGNDVVGFLHYSPGSTVVGVDVSRPSLDEAAHRLRLHGFDAKLVAIGGIATELNFPNDHFDVIRCAGVLHHIPDPQLMLKELARTLRENGEMQVMVYNHESIWTHLYVAYVKMIRENLYSDFEIREAFSKTTDGAHCPIANSYTAREFSALCSAAGLKVENVGCAISIHELSLLPLRFDAIMHPNFRRESREFLSSLTFNARGFPLHNGMIAGVDLCLRLRKV